MSERLDRIETTLNATGKQQLENTRDTAEAGQK